MKSPNDNKNQQKLAEINYKINQIESLLKATKNNFDILQKALINIQINGSNNKNIQTFKSILNLLISKAQKNADIHFPINYKQVNSCPKFNISNGRIDILKLIDNINFEDKDGGAWKQGFDIKVVPKKEPLNVFIVPHSHQDPEWIKTFDVYFEQHTKPILDSMLNFLFNNPKMTFIYAEIVYFERWYKTLNEEQIKELKVILQRNQLEIVTGGWVMNDEANTHFYSIITQLTEGHRWLRKNLDYVPITGWSIDLFGHSQNMPFIFKKTGLENLVIQRVHYIIKKELSRNKQLEFNWKQYWDTKSEYTMPTHMMPFFSYDVPHTCGPDPSICCQFDFLRISKYSCPWRVQPVQIDSNNVQERSETLLDQYKKKAELFRNGNNVLIPLGDDFRYLTNEEWKVQYDNYMKIIDYYRDNDQVNIRFGTLRDYFNSIGQSTISKFPTLTGDMFTYADRNDFYWSGYYTSRPLIKVLDRILMASLRSAEIAQSMSQLYQKKYGVKLISDYNSNIWNVLDEVRKNWSLSQHHDTITGTSKEHVTKGAGNRLLQSIRKSQEIFMKVSQNILNNKVKSIKDEDLFFEVEDILHTYGEPFDKNIIDFTLKTERLIYIFNSLAQPRQVVVDIPVKLITESYRIKVINSGNLNIDCQMSPLYIFDSNKLDQHKISFKVNINPLTYEQFKLIIIPYDSAAGIYKDACDPVLINVYSSMSYDIKLSTIYKIRKETMDGRSFFVETPTNKITIKSDSGHIQKLYNKNINTEYEFNLYFNTYGVRNSPETAGAYLFVPDGEGQIYTSDFVHIFHLTGNIYDEVVINKVDLKTHLKFYKVNGLLSNVIDVLNNVDISKQHDFELSMVVSTNALRPNNTFYTDSNCLQYMKRITQSKLPLQANVYPTICASYVSSTEAGLTKKLAVLSKQPNGVRGGTLISEPKHAFIEMFQDRIIDHDDNRGLTEQMRDNKKVNKQFRILLDSWMGDSKEENLGELTISENELLNDLNYPVDKLFVKPEQNDYVNLNLASRKSLMTGFGLPCDYHMVTLRTDESEKPNILLQRHQLNCQPKYISEGSCRYSKKKFPLFKSLFDDLNLKSVQKSLITGLNISSELLNPESIILSTMDLDNWVLNFDFT